MIGWIFWQVLVPAALGGILGYLIYRWRRDAGWIVVVEFVGIVNGIIEGPHKFTLEARGGLRGGNTYAKRFRTERAAKVAAAQLRLGGMDESSSFKVKDVYVIRYQDFSSR